MVVCVASGHETRRDLPTGLSPNEQVPSVNAEVGVLSVMNSAVSVADVRHFVNVRPERVTDPASATVTDTSPRFELLTEQFVKTTAEQSMVAPEETVTRGQVKEIGFSVDWGLKVTEERLSEPEVGVEMKEVNPSAMEPVNSKLTCMIVRLDDMVITAVTPVG